VFTYSSQISIFAETVSFTATAPDGTQLAIDGQSVASGTTWTSSTLALGANEFSIDLSVDGTVVRTYQVTVTRGDPIAYLKASNVDTGDTFGDAIAISADGSTLAVGAPLERSSSSGINGDQVNDDTRTAGAAYVFVRDGNAWTQQAYIKASNTGPLWAFGASLTLSADGNTLAVGAPGESRPSSGINGDEETGEADGAGAVYVFVRDGAEWQQQAYVKASNTGERDDFGRAVALSADGNTMAVGATGEDSASTGIGGFQEGSETVDSGAVYVFARAGSTWTQNAYVKASNTGLGDHFGSAVALSGDGNTLAVGAPEEDSGSTGVAGSQQNDDALDSGAVYVFWRNNNVWKQQVYVKASDSNPNAQVGVSLSLSSDGNTLAIGSWGEAAYVLTRDGSDWSQYAILQASNANEGAIGFGSAVSLAGDGQVLVVGAEYEGSPATSLDGSQTYDENSYLYNAGAVYIFGKEASTWSRRHYVKATNTDRPDYFGCTVAMSSDGDIVAVGAWNEASGNGDPNDNRAGSAGAVYVYR
jgi:hypothetical protein